MSLKRSLKIYFPVIVIYLFIYLLLQLVFIGQREPIHLRRSRRRLHAGDSLTNIFLSSGEPASEEESGSEGRKTEGEKGRDNVIILLFGRNYPHQLYRDAQLPEGIC